MIDLLIVLAVSAVVLPWVIVRAADWLDGMKHMDSRAWSLTLLFHPSSSRIYSTPSFDATSMVYR